jgi:hypothetical protein
MGDTNTIEELRHELEQHAKFAAEHLSHLRSPIEDMYVWCLDRLQGDTTEGGKSDCLDVHGMFEHVLHERRSAEAYLLAIRKTLIELRASPG